MKTYVIGDIHGARLALEQVLIRSPVKKGDRIIFLGDLVDGWSESYEVIDFILKLQKDYDVINIKGNHDQWFLDYIKTGIHGSNWQHGARATFESYKKHTSGVPLFIPDEHIRFFESQINYFIDDQNRCFVHGGFNRHELINEQHFQHIYYWDRDLWYSALSYMKGDYPFKTKNNFKEVYIGHTQTTNWDYDERNLPKNIEKGYLNTPITTPMCGAEFIWNLDTGCGYRGKLTIMDIDTKEYWQSDSADTLYPFERGRN